MSSFNTPPAERLGGAPAASQQQNEMWPFIEPESEPVMENTEHRGSIVVLAVRVRAASQPLPLIELRAIRARCGHLLQS